MCKIKILEFVGSMNCGGTETMLMNVFRKFDKEKYEFTFMVNTTTKGWYDDEILAQNGKIVSIKRLEDMGIKKYIEYLTSVLKEGHYDVVHSHTFLHSGFVMQAAKNAGITVRITHSHSAMDHYEKSIKYKIKKKLLQKLILKNSTNLLACSTEAGYCLFGKEFEKRGTVIKNPIRVEEIKEVVSDNERKMKLIKEYEINSNQIVLGHVGRFVTIKNHSFLLRIAKELKNRKIDFKMFLIGDGELYEDIREKCKELQLEKDIIFTGNIKNVYEHINLFDVFLLPSLYEGLPLTAIEAQGFGDKCLISEKVSKEIDLNIGLVKFLSIDSGINIWIEKILETNNKTDKNTKKSIQALINNGYDINSTIKTLERLYNV